MTDSKYITGFWINSVSEKWQPDKALLDFLQRGEKPIYIGFGSTVGGSYKKALNLEEISHFGENVFID